MLLVEGRRDHQFTAEVADDAAGEHVHAVQARVLA
jgi:hypothetical protein